MKHTYRTVDPGFLDEAPIRVTVVQDVPASAAQILEVFEDAGAWTDWMGLDDVTWTSEKPYGEGTTRIVKSGPFEFHETFLWWDQSRGCCFYFNGGSTGLVDAFMEDYRITEIEPDLCRVEWHLGISLKGVARAAGPLVGAYMRRFGVKGFRKLATFVGN